MTAAEKTMRGRSSMLPAAVRRGSTLALTVGFVGTSVLVAPAAMAEVPHTASTEVGENGEGAWTPEPSQAVLASSASGQLLGPNIDGEINAAEIADTGVLPGQTVLFEIVADLEGSTEVEVLEGSDGIAGQTQVEGETTGPIVGFALEAQLPEGMTANLESLQIQDSRLVGGGGGSVISAQNYSVTQDGSTVRVEFSDAWIESRLATEVEGENELRATINAQVGEDTSPFTEMTSEAEQIVQTPFAVFTSDEEDEDAEPVFQNYDTREDPNEFRIAANSTNFVLPGAEPETAVYAVDYESSEGIGAEVGERVAVGGDMVHFRTLLDGTLGASVETEDFRGDSTEQFAPQDLDLAYSLDRFGYIESFDASALQISAADVSVVAFGYNVAGEDGSDSVGDVSRDIESITDVTDQFAVSVNGSTGTLSVLALDPDAAAHAGLDYEIRYDATVRDVSEDTSLQNTGAQVLNDVEYPVQEASSVTVQALSVSKSAIELIGDADDEESEITELDSVPANGEFTYRFQSSETPADALYEVEFWALADEYTSGDRALHDRWSVRAETAIVGADGETAFEAGDVIADQDNRTYFQARPSGDSLEVAATDSFLELIGQDANTETAQSWAVYVDAVRTASEGDRVSNTVYEWRNNAERGFSLTSATGPGSEEEPETVTPPAEEEDEAPEEEEEAAETPAEETEEEPAEESETPANTGGNSSNGSSGGDGSSNGGSGNGSGNGGSGSGDGGSDSTPGTSGSGSSGNGDGGSQNSGSGNTAGTAGSGTPSTGSNGSSGDSDGSRSTGTSGSTSDLPDSDALDDAVTASVPRGSTGDDNTAPVTKDSAIDEWEASDHQVGDTLADRGSLAETGTAAPWFIGGGALLLLAAGASAFLLNRRRTMGQ